MPKHTMHHRGHAPRQEKAKLSPKPIAAIAQAMATEKLCFSFSALAFAFGLFAALLFAAG